MVSNVTLAPGIQHKSRPLPGFIYHQAFIARNGLTRLINETALTTWRNTQTPTGTGAPRISPDTPIRCAVVVKSTYRLSLRAAPGFVPSVIQLMMLELPILNSSTSSRPQGASKVLLFSSKSRPCPFVINCIGLWIREGGE